MLKNKTWNGPALAINLCLVVIGVCGIVLVANETIQSGGTLRWIAAIPWFATFLLITALPAIGRWVK